MLAYCTQQLLFDTLRRPSRSPSASSRTAVPQCQPASQLPDLPRDSAPPLHTAAGLVFHVPRGLERGWTLPNTTALHSQCSCRSGPVPHHGSTQECGKWLWSQNTRGRRRETVMDFLDLPCQAPEQLRTVTQVRGQGKEELCRMNP